MSNPFHSTTLDTSNELISKMSSETKRRCEDMITSTDLTTNSLTTPQLQNHLVWSLLTKLLTNCSSTAEKRCQQSPSVLNYPQLVKMTPNDIAYTRWGGHSGLANTVQIVSTPPAPSNGCANTVLLGQAGHADPLDSWQCSS